MYYECIWALVTCAPLSPDDEFMPIVFEHLMGSVNRIVRVSQCKICAQAHTHTHIQSQNKCTSIPNMETLNNFD